MYFAVFLDPLYYSGALALLGPKVAGVCAVSTDKVDFFSGSTNVPHR